MFKNLLLDTCALIWLASNEGKISKKTLSLIDEAKFVYISSISAWEISLLEKKSQLKFDVPAEKWLVEFTTQQDIQIINIDINIAIKSNQLDFHHKDPADRLIIASALIHNLIIITADSKFSLYGVETMI